MIKNINTNAPEFDGWEFTLIPNSDILYYKSPRLEKASDYNALLWDDSNEELLKHEKLTYLSQVMWPVAQQLQNLQDDIRRQLRVHVDRGLVLPTELKVDMTLKIV